MKRPEIFTNAFFCDKIRIDGKCIYAVDRETSRCMTYD